MTTTDDGAQTNKPAKQTCHPHTPPDHTHHTQCANQTQQQQHDDDDSDDTAEDDNDEPQQTTTNQPVIHTPAHTHPTHPVSIPEPTTTSQTTTRHG